MLWPPSLFFTRGLALFQLSSPFFCMYTWPGTIWNPGTGTSKTAAPRSVLVHDRKMRMSKDKVQLQRPGDSGRWGKYQRPLGDFVAPLRKWLILPVTYMEYPTIIYGLCQGFSRGKWIAIRTKPNCPVGQLMIYQMGPFSSSRAKIIAQLQNAGQLAPFWEKDIVGAVFRVAILYSLAVSGTNWLEFRGTYLYIYISYVRPV